MNTKNLTQIFNNYIKRFDWLTAPESEGGVAESYKWKAVHNFREVFDIEADDFAAMLKQAREASVNLIDSYIQPFSGLVVMAEQDGEAETIRDMFRSLYEDDGNDLTVRQEKIDVFLQKADELLAKHYPDSFLYKHDQRAVMGYLWLHDPDNHYLVKNTEAQYLANAVEFYNDWGTYANFKLDVYHRFCDELVEEIKKYPPLLEVHNSRFDGCESEMYPDKNLHVLVFDIIYCTGKYNLYDGVVIKSHTAKDKELYRTRKQKAAELAEQLASAKHALEQLQSAYAAAKDLFQPGMKLVHKKYGAGTLQEYDGKRITFVIDKSGEEKVVDMAMTVGNGIIKASGEDFQEFAERYRFVLKDASNIPRRAEIAARAMEPYKEFLD